MGYVPVAEGRAQVQSVPGGIELRIPARRQLLVVLFLGFWLVGWCLGEVMATTQLIAPTPVAHGDPPPLEFLALWLCAWTVGGVFALYSLLWLLSGRERVTITGEALTVRREIFGLGLSKAYRLGAVRDLRVVDIAPVLPFSFGRGDLLGRSSGPIAFDYGAKTIRFGAGIDAAEAKQLVAKVLAAKPQLAPQDP